MNQLEISKFPTLEYAANEAFNTLSTSLFYCGTDIKTILITRGKVLCFYEPDADTGQPQ